MSQLKHIIITLILIALINDLSGQNQDSILNNELAHPDTFYWIHENEPKNKIWGNSWYSAGSVNFSKNNQYDLNIGRTYGNSTCGGAGCMFHMRSYGIGYGFTSKNEQQIHFAKAYWENCVFYIPPISAGIRAEYAYGLTNKSHYLQPSAGLSLFFIDIFYNYSFNVSGTENLFRHGLTLRIKYFHRIRNWQKNYPNDC